MITSRTRAVTLLGAALVLGGVTGSLITKYGTDRGRPGSGRFRGTYASAWLRGSGADSSLLSRLDSAWVTNECITDSIQRARIGVTSESLMVSFRPVLDSLRSINRAGVRALLPDTLRPKYDSLVAADDSSRSRGWAQRNSRGGVCSEAWTRWNNRNNGPPGGGRGGRGPN